jgi:hypothetical protein
MYILHVLNPFALKEMQSLSPNLQTRSIINIRVIWELRGDHRAPQKRMAGQLAHQSLFWIITTP